MGIKKKKEDMEEPAGKKKIRLRSRKGKMIRRVIILFVVLAVIVTGVYFGYRKLSTAALGRNVQEVTFETKAAERRNIENYLSSSGTVQPLDTYSVTTVSGVEGTVAEADFEEGDMVQKGDVLYQISTDSLNNKIESAQKNVDRAEKNYEKAEKNYDEASEGYEELTVTADKTGWIKSLKAAVGDTLQNNSSQIAEVYNNKTMILSVPFNAQDVSESMVGKKAEVAFSDTGEIITGKVTKTGSIDEVLSGNRVVRYVEISVENPGGISEGMKASASVGKVFCNEEGSFAASESGFLTAKTGGEISKLYLKEGDWVEKGDVILTYSSESVDDQLDNYLEQIESAKENLEDAKASLQEILDSKEDFKITSPITGTVIQKNTKAGDTLNASSMNSTLCLIYDLSAMTFEMSVDELDVMSVKTGQTVKITADALEGEEFEGIITNISLVGSSSGGVTQYPVTVRIDEAGELLPGMNISGQIVIESADNVLAVPADALMRGSLIYVADASVTEAQGDVPAGFRAVNVEVGVSDGDYIEITKGLSEGDMVYVPGRSDTDSGMFQMTMPSMGGERPSEGNRQNGGGSQNGGFGR